MHVSVRVFGKAHRRSIDLDAVLIDEVVIGCISAGETDHSPRDHVAVAAIDGIAEVALEGAFPEMREENIGGYAAEVYPALLKAREIVVLLLRAHLRKWR